MRNINTARVATLTSDDRGIFLKQFSFTWANMAYNKLKTHGRSSGAIFFPLGAFATHKILGLQ